MLRFTRFLLSGVCVIASASFDGIPDSPSVPSLRGSVSRAAKGVSGERSPSADKESKRRDDDPLQENFEILFTSHSFYTRATETQKAVRVLQARAKKQDQDLDDEEDEEILLPTKSRTLQDVAPTTTVPLLATEEPVSSTTTRIPKYDLLTPRPTTPPPTRFDFATLDLPVKFECQTATCSEHDTYTFWDPWPPEPNYDPLQKCQDVVRKEMDDFWEGVKSTT